MPSEIYDTAGFLLGQTQTKFLDGKKIILGSNTPFFVDHMLFFTKFLSESTAGDTIPNIHVLLSYIIIIL